MTDSARVRNLERQCSILRLWCAGMTAILLASCLMGAVRPTPDTVEARLFIVRGPDGSVRAKFGLDDESANLSLFSNDQEVLAVLAAHDKGPESELGGASLYMEAGGEKTAIMLAAVGNGISGLTMSDRKHSIESFVAPERACMRFFDDGLGLGGKDSKELELFAESTTRPSLQLDIDKDGPSVEGRNKQDELLFKQP